MSALSRFIQAATVKSSSVGSQGRGGLPSLTREDIIRLAAGFENPAAHQVVMMRYLNSDQSLVIVANYLMEKFKVFSRFDKRTSRESAIKLCYQVCDEYCGQQECQRCKGHGFYEISAGNPVDCKCCKGKGVTRQSWARRKRDSQVVESTQSFRAKFGEVYLEMLDHLRSLELEFAEYMEERYREVL